jgi:hypothetical protein
VLARAEAIAGMEGRKKEALEDPGAVEERLRAGIEKV